MISFSEALATGSLLIPRQLFNIMHEVFNVKEPRASGLASATKDMKLNEVKEAITRRSYLFHDTHYILVDSLNFPAKILWMQTVYVHDIDEAKDKNIAKPRIIDPIPCRRVYGDPIALDELLVCQSISPLIGKEITLRALMVKARKKIIDIDVEGLCKGITSSARRFGGVTVYLPVLLRQRLDSIVEAIQEKGIDPEYLRSGDISPIYDVIYDIIKESLRLSGFPIL